MAFNGNIKQPKQYSGQKSTNNQNTFDRLVTVKDYDTAKSIIIAEDEKGKIFEAYINPQEVINANNRLKERGDNTAGYAWMGHSIDEKMKKAHPPGSKIILIRSKVVSSDKVSGIAKTEVHRIGGVPNPEADKTFQGYFTMNYRQDEGRERIFRVQHWNPNGVDLNNDEAINNLKVSIDDSAKNYGVKIGEHNVVEPSIGIQFRALMKTDRKYPYSVDKSKDTIYEVVDMSLPFDWMPGRLDENGNEIKSDAHPLTGDEMLGFAEGYIGYISDKFSEHLDSMKVEVCYYHTYPASKNDSLELTTGDPARDKNADKNPLYQLSHRKSFVDGEQTEFIVGKNAAVNGIIQIGANKLVKVDGKPVEIPSYWVTKIFANNTRGHIHAFIRSEEGYKTEPHESLKIIKEDVPQNKTSFNNNQEVNHAPQQAVAPEAAPSAHVPAAVPVESEFDPFADNNDVPSAAPVVERAPLRFGAKS